MDSVFFLNEGDLVTLVGKTRHGKNRINQHGSKWEVIELRNGKMLLESENETEGPRDNKGRDWRWVDLHDDKDFTWSIA